MDKDKRPFWTSAIAIVAVIVVLQLMSPLWRELPFWEQLLLKLGGALPAACIAVFVLHLVWKSKDPG